MVKYIGGVNMLMKNKDIIRRFLNKGGDASNYSKNLHIIGNKLINYSTIIAMWDNGKLLISNRKYSPTTSKHQNMIKREYPDYIEVEHNILN